MSIVLDVLAVVLSVNMIVVCEFGVEDENHYFGMCVHV